MRISVTSWLEKLGLRQYSAAFEAVAIDLETLPDLEETDLASMGIPIGHRKLILRAFASNKILRPNKAAEAERRYLKLGGTVRAKEKAKFSCLAVNQGLASHASLREFGKMLES